MCAIVGNLVVLDHDESGNTAGESKIVESCVSPGAVLLLLRCMRGLENENTLGEQEDCGRVEQLQNIRVSIAYTYSGRQALQDVPRTE